VTHYFAWGYWLKGLHFRYGYEIFMLRRLDKHYPNQWIARTNVLEPVISMMWHILLDFSRWFRVSRLLGIPLLRRISILPVLLGMSCLAHTAEMLGMYSTMVSPESMRNWAESV
jgi:hypothetical protein